MAQEQLLRFLQSTGVISGSKAQEIAAHFNEKNFTRGELFLEAGKHSDDYLFLEKGLMRAFALDTEGREVTTGFYSSGQVVFEVSSFFNRTRSQESIEALTSCKGWTLTFQELNALFHSLPEFREFGRHLLVKGFTMLKARMLSTITERAEVRYARLLEQAPELFQQAPLKHIASYLGVTDTSLSRIRKELARK